jgi:hypothetical protein
LFWSVNDSRHSPLLSVDLLFHNLFFALESMPIIQTALSQDQSL